MHAGWYSGLFPWATLLRRSLSGRRLASKPDVAGALRTRHNPASQCLRRSSVSRIGNAAAREAASCEQSFFGKRSTDGGDRLRSGGAYDSRAARQGNQKSDTQFTDRNDVTAYHVL